jgi:flagellar basal body rod protein FlgG
MGLKKHNGFLFIAAIATVLLCVFSNVHAGSHKQTPIIFQSSGSNHSDLSFHRTNSPQSLSFVNNKSKRGLHEDHQNLYSQSRKSQLQNNYKKAKHNYSIYNQNVISFNVQLLSGRAPPIW